MAQLSPSLFLEIVCFLGMLPLNYFEEKPSADSDKVESVCLSILNMNFSIMVQLEMIHFQASPIMYKFGRLPFFCTFNDVHVDTVIGFVGFLTF